MKRNQAISRGVSRRRGTLLRAGDHPSSGGGVDLPLKETEIMFQRPTVRYGHGHAPRT